VLHEFLHTSKRASKESLQYCSYGALTTHVLMDNVHELFSPHALGSATAQEELELPSIQNSAPLNGIGNVGGGKTPIFDPTSSP
jgi:hypothetical protein